MLAINRFKKSQLYNIKGSGETASANYKGDEGFIKRSDTLIRKEEYTMEKILNVDENPLF